MEAALKKYDVIVVGSGISGATIAERYARLCNKKVLVLEKRNHIGGNCYDEYDPAGILVSKYGPHVFHTNDEEVWKYVSTFTKWHEFTYKAVSYVDGIHVPIPVNIATVNTLFTLQLQNQEDMRAWLKKNTVPIANPQNSEEAALARVGKVLYEKLFKHYTEKQWDVPPHKLAPSVLNRIPVHTDFDDRYFSDVHQAVPRDGYTKMFERMLNHPNITVVCNADYFSLKDSFQSYEKMFFTGPIDKFFGDKFEKLQYRSLRFEYETHDVEQYQSHPAVHYPNTEKFTRIVEYKKFTGQKHSRTTISKEFPTWDGEPYYPVPTERNQKLYEMYQQEAAKLEKDGIYFVGRLANYKYFNMDQAFRNALDLFKKLEDNTEHADHDNCRM